MLEERVGLIGKWIVRLIGIGWSVASVFAIPIIVMEEERNPITILKRSAGTLKKTWGESLTGFIGIQAAGTVVILLSLLAFVVVTAVGVALEAPWLILVFGVLWVCGLFAFFYTLGVASNVYRGALYLFAANGEVPGYFDGNPWISRGSARRAEVCAGGSRLGNQHGRAGRPPALEIAMRRGRVLERVRLADVNLHLPRLHDAEEFAHRAFERGARRHVVIERRAREKERPTARQLERRHRRHGPRRIAVGHHEPERLQEIERLLERVLATES